MSESRLCRQCQSGFEITDADLAFYEKVSPVFQSKKYQIPAPTVCPTCRLIRRLAFRNERNLYERKCDKTGKNIISIYSPDKLHPPVWENSEWYSEHADFTVFGRGFDFSRPFFEQFWELKKLVPARTLLNQSHLDDINSQYTNQAGYNKNCYLCFGAGGNEDCLYGYRINGTKNLVDCTSCEKVELMYECVDCINSYHCFFSQNLQNCNDCYFSFELISCRNCFGCINLTQKEYCIFNKQYSKEEYLEKMRQYNLGSFSQIKELLTTMRQHVLKFPRKPLHTAHNENTTGDNLYYSKNSFECYDCLYLEDCKYCHVLSQEGPIKDCYDFTVWGRVCELVYESQNCGGSIYSMAFCNDVWHNCQNVLYCDNSLRIKNCFGCIGLQGKEYCILNKQYTKAEYEKLVPQIIEHMQKNNEWGEFFPPALSPFGYNETVAQEYFPLTREQVLQDISVKTHSNTSLQQGQIFHWSDYESPPPQVEKIITKDQMTRLPDNIKDIPDEIVNWALTCEISGKPYRIIKQELQFYREHNIPVPRRHPDQRHKDRLALRNPRRLWERQCDCNNTSHNHHTVETQRVASLPNVATKCPATFQTTYAPDRPEIVFCEFCYRKEVY